jgi:hypothetical protein
MAATAQHLDGDHAIELGVVRRVDHAHAAGTDLVRDHISPDLRAGREHAIDVRP